MKRHELKPRMRVWAAYSRIRAGKVHRPVRVKLDEPVRVYSKRGTSYSVGDVWDCRVVRDGKAQPRMPLLDREANLPEASSYHRNDLYATEAEALKAAAKAIVAECAPLGALLQEHLARLAELTPGKAKKAKKKPA
jgi:hypothetical protein